MKLREIERLRGVAILLVFVVHSRQIQSLLPEVARMSGSGVDLFFVISGYVVTLSLIRMLPPLEAEASFIAAFARAKDTLRAFYARRFFRILPPALAVLVLVRVLIVWNPQTYGSPKELAGESLTFLGGLYNYALAYHPDYRLGPFWSLAVEEHFYLLLPVLFVAFRTAGARLGTAAGIALFSVLARTLPPPEGANAEVYARFSSHLRFDSLMAGVALALVAGKAASSPILPRGVMRFLVLPMCIVLVACLPGAAPTYVMLHEGFIALWVLSGIVVAFAALDQGYVLSFPVVAPVLEYVGSRSYALYLIHSTMFRVEESIGMKWAKYRSYVPTDVPSPWRQVAMQLALAFVGAEILHRTVERPFMRLGRGLVDPIQRSTFRVSRRAKISSVLVTAALLVILGHHKILLALGPANLARGCHVTMSSHLDGKPDGDALVDGTLESELGAHTEEEDYPWMTIDFGKPTEVGSLRIYNRADGYEDQQVPLQIEFSNDDAHFQLVAERKTNFTQEHPWALRIDAPPVRYVRLRVNKRGTHFCLSEVEAFEGHAMARMP